MMSYIEHFDVQDASIRHQPYMDVAHDPRGRYYDFVQHPELIPTVLEEFLPYSDKAAVKRFYDMLAWLNGSESMLETNDCRFDPPAPNASTNVSPKLLQSIVTVVLFYRHPNRNLSPGSRSAWTETRGMKFPIGDRVQLLCNIISAAVDSEMGRNLVSCCRIGAFPSLFTQAQAKEQDRLGHCVGIQMWVWGDDETEVFDNLITATAALATASRELAAKQPILDQLQPQTMM